MDAVAAILVVIWTQYPSPSHGKHRHRVAILNSVEQQHGHWDLVHSRLLRLPHKLADRLRHIAASETDGSVRQRIEATLSRLAHLHKRGAQSPGKG
jgi:hypothetical protein